MTTRDDLKKVLLEFENAAHSCGIEIIRGWLNSSEHASTIVYETGEKDCCVAFLTQAKKLGVLAVVLNIVVLDEADLGNAIGLAEAAEAGESAATVLDLLKRCNRRVGEIARLCANYVLPGTFITVEIDITTPWYEAVYDTESLLNEDETGDSHEDSSLNDDEVEQAANEMANLPQFQSAKNKETRTLLARKYLRTKFADREWEWRVDTIVQTAKSVYENEIKPELDDKMRAKAEELFGQGLSKIAVARQLKVTVNQLEKLV